MTTPEPINWSDFGIYGTHQLPTDWQHVLTVDEGGYEWTTFHAFWSPTARRYYWSGGAGCSCNYWSQDLSTVADFEDGPKDALARAVRAFVAEHYILEESDAVTALDELRRFTPAKAGA